MSILTMHLEASDAAASDTGLFARLIRAREAGSARRTLAYLASQSDVRLQALGFGIDDIRALRNGELRLPVAR